MSGIGPISDYDAWKLASPYDEREDGPEEDDEGYHVPGCQCPECVADRLAGEV